MSAALAQSPPGAQFRLGALACIADARGGLYLPDRRTLLVADLHLEKGSAFARRGMLAPPYDTRATLAVLAALIADWMPARVIALGDNFHDDGGAARLCSEDAAMLAQLQRGRDWLWIAGNHDPAPPAGVGGDVAPFLHLDGVLLWHAASARDPRPQIAGHLHPCARVAGRGRNVRRKCFATDGHRLILPALGAYTGGLNILGRAFAGLFDDRVLTAHVLGDARLYSIARGMLLPDRG